MNISKIKRILFYGCSFTAGAELADQELLPNLPKTEIDKLKKEEKYHFYNRFDVDLREKLEKEKSWARWFADDVGLPYENRAKGGSSTSQIVFSIEEDLARNAIEDTDIIIVGTTSPERICKFTNFGAESIILNQNQWPASFEREFLMNIANDNYLLFNWYKEIKYLDLLSNRLGNRLYQQWVWATWDQNLDFVDNNGPFYKLDPYMKKILHPGIVFDSFINNNISFTSLNAWYPENQEVLHHPKLHIQQQFGKMIAESFKAKVS